LWTSEIKENQKTVKKNIDSLQKASSNRIEQACYKIENISLCCISPSFIESIHVWRIKKEKFDTFMFAELEVRTFNTKLNRNSNDAACGFLAVNG
jgi:hypothetical protein